MYFEGVEDILKPGATTIRELFLEFIKEIKVSFSCDYLQYNNEEELKKIIAINSGRGFPGLLGSWDCEQ